jgi:hypothetical protein
LLPSIVRQLPVSDVAKTEDRIQKTGFRNGAKPRRQKPAVGFGGTALKMEASKTGSLAVAPKNRPVAEP